MDSHPLAARMTGRLPKAMQAGVRIRALFTALGEEMACMGETTKLLMRSRWYRHARGWFDANANLATKRTTELGRLAAMFGLYPGRDETTPHFRRRLAEYVHIHRAGMGTARAILRLAALVYRAQTDPHIYWKDGTAVAQFSVADADNTRRLRLELSENPLEPAAVTFSPMQPGNTYAMTNDSLDAPMPRLVITPDPSHNRAVAVPMLVHKESGIRILYVGRIGPDTQLQLQSNALPRLLGKEALGSGGPGFESSAAGTGLLMTGGGARFNRIETRFDEAAFAAFTAQGALPALQPGQHHWVYRTLTRKELASYLLRQPDRDRLLKNAADEEGPPIRLTISWRGRRPACFVLKIPGDYVPPFMENFRQLHAALNRMLQYGRAAGVQARLETALRLKEALKLADRPGRMQAGLRVSDVSEKPPLGEIMAAPAMALGFTDRLQPGERWATSGILDNAHFDYATFTKGVETGERAGSEKDRHDRAGLYPKEEQDD